MAEPKQRQRPKGGELRDSLRGNPEQSYRRARRAKQLPDRFTEQDMQNIRARQIPSLKESAQGVLGAAVAAEATDPYLSRNEFKEGFYDQPKPPVSYETLKGTAAKPIPNVTDTESFADGGSVRGQKVIQVKKKPFRGIF
jgi:hypothetical protein